MTAAKPAARHGAERLLRVGGGPKAVSLLRFDLRSFPQVQGAWLTLHAKRKARGAVVVRRLRKPGFAERGVRWKNRPRPGAVVGRIKKIRPGQPLVVNVTGALSSDGTLSVALTRRARKAVAFFSREHPSLKPTLTLLAGPQGTSAPAPKPTLPSLPVEVPDPFPTPYPTAPPLPTPSYKLDSSFDRPSKSDPDDYRMHVDFNMVCDFSTVASDDPIVLPAQLGLSHSHVFSGNTTTNAFTTQESLEAGGTNCQLDRDKASYWMPELYDETGKPVAPYHMRAYYRAATLGKVSHIPRGLRMIAGDSKATSPQDPGIAGWHCRTVDPDDGTIPKQATIPSCRYKELLEGSVVFPNCWNGKYLDSADHKSHMSYSNGDKCDAAHPVHIPQLTLAYRYPPGTTNRRSYLASGHSGLTLHADFWNAWDEYTLDALVDRCINAGVHCGDVSPKHFPGPIPPEAPKIAARTAVASRRSSRRVTFTRPSPAALLCKTGQGHP